MSEVRATTLSDTAGSGPTDLTGQWASKAFAHYNQSTNTTYDTENVSSITDVGAGDFDVDLTNSLSISFFTTLATEENGSGGGRVSGSDSTTASQIRVITRNLSATLTDATRASVAAFGDLA